MDTDKPNTDSIFGDVLGSMQQVTLRNQTGYKPKTDNHRYTQDMIRLSKL